MRKKISIKIGISLCVLIALYCVMPIVAGLWDLGKDRRGPKIYNRVYHEFLYSISYQLVRGEKPRVPFDRDRVWIYGF